MDAIDLARKGDLEFFKKAPLNILLNARDYDGGTVLSIVVDANHVDCCEEICKRCPSLLCSQHYQGGYTPLHVAAYSGFLDILEILISTCDKAGLENQHDIEDQGGDRADRQKTLTLRTTTSDGYNAMHKAIHGGQPESIKLLIEADPNNKLLRAGDYQNNTPLHLAVETNQLEIARFLIEADPDFLYGVNSVGKTPILIAIDRAQLHNGGEYSEMVKLIMELQPTQSMVNVNENGWTALHYSVSRGFLHSLGSIIQSCPESSMVADNEGQSFIHHAVKSGNMNIVERILGMKEITPSLIYHKSKGGHTALDYAVSRGSILILSFLIQAGAKFPTETSRNHLLTIVDDQGDTALHKAVLTNQYMMVKLLVGADPDYEYGANKSRYTPITLSIEEARSKENKFDSGEIRKLLFKMQARQTMEWRGGNCGTLLHDAAYKGDLSCIEDIIEVCPGILDVEDNEGKNFLHIAAELEKIEVVKLVFRAKDIPPNVLYNQDKDGNTPMHIAAKTKNKLLMGCFLFDPRFETANWFQV